MGQNTIWHSFVLTEKSHDILQSWPFLTLENIMDSEVKIPENVRDVYKILYTDNTNEPCSARKSHMVEEKSANSILAWSEGRLIPEKHLPLRLTVKSLTKGKTMVSLSNSFGASDETIKQINLDLKKDFLKSKP